MNNTRFATALHILTLMTVQKNVLLSSEYIAGSINVNPAIVRKEIIQLKKAGLVISKEGKGGGNTLAQAPSRILLADIYAAVQTTALLGRPNDPNPKCPVGKQINKHLSSLYNEAEQAIKLKLGKKTLQSFCNDFR
jgi:Rrf2 family protein